MRGGRWGGKEEEEEESVRWSSGAFCYGTPLFQVVFETIDRVADDVALVTFHRGHSLSRSSVPQGQKRRRSDVSLQYPHPPLEGVGGARRFRSLAKNFEESWSLVVSQPAARGHFLRQRWKNGEQILLNGQVIFCPVSSIYPIGSKVNTRIMDSGGIRKGERVGGGVSRIPAEKKRWKMIIGSITLGYHEADSFVKRRTIEFRPSIRWHSIVMSVINDRWRWWLRRR